jgi:hypothetical protein
VADEQFTKGHLVTLVISTLIGVGFGAGWWFAGASAAPDAAVVLRVLGVVVVLAFLGWTIRLVRRGTDLPPGGGSGDSPFGRQYGVVVAVMVVAIVGGSRVLSSVIDRPDAVAAWVLFCVGAHFFPFAKIFGSRRFVLLAGLLCGVSVLAVALGASGLTWAWLAVPGFGGALVLWAIAAAGLSEGSKLVHAG